MRNNTFPPFFSEIYKKNRNAAYATVPLCHCVAVMDVMDVMDVLMCYATVLLCHCVTAITDIYALLYIIESARETL